MVLSKYIFVKFILVAFLIILQSCVSSTLIHSSPEGAKIYTNSNFLCTTPCKYSDTKIVGSTTNLVLKKEGYKNLYTSLTRDEKVEAGPTVAGFFFFPSWLWALGYLPGRTFELEKEGLLRKATRPTEKLPNLQLKSSGSCFAINTDGYVVTNYHVIEGGSTFLLRGVHGDFYKTYKVKVVAKDIHNDLALLKIVDEKFSKFESLGYGVLNSNGEVGEEVFALGYPLRATMGDEVKLTNGIISSKTGFQGNISSYQVTVPVQPGNSGGPMFNSQGSVIGIINAKHLKADNASYAIKSPYLFNLINSLDEKVDVSSSNTLQSSSLTTQVKQVKKHVFIVETYR